MIEIILSNLPWVWFALVIVFTIIEVVTMGLTTIWFAIGSIVMIFVSFSPIPFKYQILLFLLLSSALLIFTRPSALRKLKIGNEKTNTQSIIGKTAIVTKTITRFDKGEIKSGGIFWTAKTENEEPLQKGSECVIIRIDGVTAIVEKSTASI